MNDYYVYIYLDPRKPGKYKYGEYKFDYEPFYVGKGKGRRYIVKQGRTEYFKRKLNKIKKYGMIPIIIKLFDNISEKRSFDIEKQLIYEIEKVSSGILINMTNGGEGISGYKHSKKSKKLISKNLKGIYRSRETKQNMSKSKIGYMNPSYNNIVYFDVFNDELPKKQYGEKNPSAKLSEYNVIGIWGDILRGELTQTEIAKKYNVEKTIISNIKRGKKWKYVYFNFKLMYLNKILIILNEIEKRRSNDKLEGG